MAVSRETVAPWWPAVWVVTSALLVLVVSRVESGLFLALFYLGLNACTVLYLVLSDRPRRDRMLPIIGWCAAAQLPVMLWLFANVNRAPERFNSHNLLEDAQRRNNASER